VQQIDLSNILKALLPYQEYWL